jgi:hypothetical protein
MLKPVSLPMLLATAGALALASLGRIETRDGGTVSGNSNMYHPRRHIIRVLRSYDCLYTIADSSFYQTQLQLLREGLL